MWYRGAYEFTDGIPNIVTRGAAPPLENDLNVYGMKGMVDQAS